MQLIIPFVSLFIMYMIFEYCTRQKFEFSSGKMLSGKEMAYIPQLANKIDALKARCVKLGKKCKAFTTDGYFFSKLDTSEPEIRSNSKQGTYIKI